ncbi:18437_t:CDS:2, partial [Acaulospora morrowiae]
MGCCFSKEEEEPDERTPLLDGGNTYKPTKFPRYDRFKEEELLQKIVQRTAENLIDISNTHATERLQPPDFIDRTNEFKELISTIKLDSKALQKIQRDNSLTKLQDRTSSSQQTRPPHLVLKDG